MLWGGPRRWSTFLLCTRIVLPRPASPSVSRKNLLCWIHARPASNATLRRAPQVAPNDRSAFARHPEHRLPVTRAKLTQTLVKDAEDLPRLIAIINGLCSADLTADEMASLIQQLQQSFSWLSFLRDARRVGNIVMLLAASKHPASAHHLLIIAHKMGAVFKPGLFESIACELARQKRWHLIPPFIQVAHRQLGKSSLRLLNWLTRSIAELQNYSSLNNIPQIFLSYNISPDRRTYHTIIKAHLLNHDVLQANAWIQKMVDGGFDVDATTDAVLMSAYRGLGPDKTVRDRACKAIALLDSANGTLVANSMLRIAKDRGSEEEALKALQMFDGLGADLVLSTFGAMATGSNGTIALVERSPAVVRADLATFAFIILTVAEHRDLPWLIRLANRMKESGLTPNAETAAALIRALYAQNLEHLAIKVLHDLCQPVQCPSASNLFRQLGYREESSDPSFGPFSGGPFVKAFDAVLQCSLSRHGFKLVKPLLQLIRLLDIVPSSKTTEFLLSYAERIGAPRSRLLTLGSLIASERSRPSVRHVNILLRALVQAEKRAAFKTGWNALGAVVRDAVAPPRRSESPTGFMSDISGPTSGVVFPASWAAGATLSDILDDLTRRGVKGTRATIALRMRLAALSQSSADGPSARQVMNAMAARGMHPTAHHYAALMEAHTMAGDMLTARSVLREAISQIQPNQKSLVILHTILISGYARLGRPDRAMQTFQNMLREKVAPDAAAVDAVVSAFFAVKAFKLAREVLLELWPMVAPPVDGMRNASLMELVTKLRSLRSDKGQLRFECWTPKMNRRLRKIISLWQSMFLAPRAPCFK